VSLTRTRLRARVVYGGLGTAVEDGAAVEYGAPLMIIE